MADMFILKSIEFDPDKFLKRKGLEEKGEVQQFIDSETLRICEPFVPFDQGALIDSGKIHTTIGSGEVEYRTVYARRWYYMPANFQGAPQRGNYWFERAIHEQGGKDQILRGVQKFLGGQA